LVKFGAISADIITTVNSITEHSIIYNKNKQKATAFLFIFVFVRFWPNLAVF
jgi:Na+-translocating ferredoxin:NAD+ oxidoreductase RnfG subunit